MPYYMHPQLLTCEFLIRGPLSHKDSWGQGDDHELDSFHFCAFGVPEKPYKTSGLAAEESICRGHTVRLCGEGEAQGLQRERDHPTFPGLELSSAFQPS